MRGARTNYGDRANGRNITLRLYGDNKRYVEELAEKDGCSVADVVVRLIEDRHGRGRMMLRKDVPKRPKDATRVLLDGSDRVYDCGLSRWRYDPSGKRLICFVEYVVVKEEYLICRSWRVKNKPHLRYARRGCPSLGTVEYVVVKEEDE